MRNSKPEQKGQGVNNFLDKFVYTKKRKLEDLKSEIDDGLNYYQGFSAAKKQGSKK